MGNKEFKYWIFRIFFSHAFRGSVILFVHRINIIVFECKVLECLVESMAFGDNSMVQRR